MATDEREAPQQHPEIATALGATPSMEEMLNAQVSPSGAYGDVDAQADPYRALTIAQELFDARRYADAAKLLDEVQKSPEGRTRAVRELLARSYYHSAQLGRAVSAASELLTDDPTNADVALLLTRALQRAGRRDEAASALKQARALGAEI